MRPGKGEWGLTEMLRYAKKKHGFTFFIADDSVIKGMRRKLKELEVRNGDGGWVFPEARARAIVDNELLGYLEDLSKDDAARDEETRVSKRKQLVSERIEAKYEYADANITMIDQQTGSTNTVKVKARTGMYADMQDQYIEDLQAYDEDGVSCTYVVNDQELFFAEMRLMFKHLLESEGAAFDRAGFEQDYRKYRQAQIESRIENDEPNKAAEELVVILEEKLSSPDAYITRRA